MGLTYSERSDEILQDGGWPGHPGSRDHDKPTSPLEDKDSCVQVREMCGQDSGICAFSMFPKSIARLLGE